MLRIELSAAWLALASLGCHGRASPDECRAIGDRYIDLATREAPGAASMSPAQAAAVRDVELGVKRAEPGYRLVQDHCEDLTRAEVSCAANASTTRDWEACIRSGDR
jgi:hypothetical protein